VLRVGVLDATIRTLPIALCFSLSLLAQGCRPPAAGQPADRKVDRPGGSMTASGDARVAELSATLLGEYLRRDPVAATAAGEHRYDGAWPDLSAEADADLRRFLMETLRQLDEVPPGGLGAQAAVDRDIARNQLRYWLFSIDELREAEHNPLYYTRVLGDGLDPLLTRAFAPAPERARSLAARLGALPQVVAVGMKRLTGAPPLHTETAIQQNRGLIELCAHGLGEAEAAASDRAAFRAAAATAREALERFGVFLERELLPRSHQDFRLGRALFEKKLRFELDDDIDIDALARDARALLDATVIEMAATSLVLWPELFPGEAPPSSASLAAPEPRRELVRKVLARLADERPTNETIVADASRLLEQATTFVREHDLAQLPSEPCRVIEMPEYRRGVAIAYCDSSGALEAKPETFFAIAPTPKGWPPERVASFYREYNASMLADLVVHEAMPGHFLQLMHNNRFPSKLRAVFSSGAFVEGWAVYTEWLMASQGFGGPRVRLMQQKMLLRVATNAILDHGVHAGGMEEAQALSLMTREGFQEEGEAVGKWRRAKMTGAQLSTYFYGYAAMRRLRARAEAAPGFDQRAYHDRLLSFGSPPMRHADALMASASR
jgi:uncharacterized protein (DUF885 family)